MLIQNFSERRQQNPLVSILLPMETSGSEKQAARRENNARLDLCTPWLLVVSQGKMQKQSQRRRTGMFDPHNSSDQGHSHLILVGFHRYGEHAAIYQLAAARQTVGRRSGKERW